MVNFSSLHVAHISTEQAEQLTGAADS
jgi:hypothetical protein